MSDSEVDDIIEKYITYEDYLDDQYTSKDMLYLENEDLARELVELGYRGSSNTISRKKFNEKKKEYNYKTSPNYKLNLITPLYHIGIPNLSNNKLLYELAIREKDIQLGKSTLIIYLRTFNDKNQEISGYIDYGHRLKIEKEQFKLYFESKKKLEPKPNDLSYYNWETKIIGSKSTMTFQILGENLNGLIFKNKRNRKIININPYCNNKNDLGDNVTKIEILTSNYDNLKNNYQEIILYEQTTRKKNI